MDVLTTYGYNLLTPHDVSNLIFVKANDMIPKTPWLMCEASYYPHFQIEVQVGDKRSMLFFESVTICFGKGNIEEQRFMHMVETMGFEKIDKTMSNGVITSW